MRKRDDEPTEEVEEADDEEATLADDLLDEVGDTEEVPEEIEGFGLLAETPEEPEEEEKEEEEKTEEVSELEDDAEDVDFDRFDDVDEM